MSNAVADVDPRRHVSLDAVHNFRDLGGYTLGDGRTIAWGRLFRADGLHRLTASDLDRLRPLGLRTVIDLRTHDEVAERGTFPVAAHHVELHHLPVLDVTWDVTDRAASTTDDLFDEEVEFLVWAYRRMLEVGSRRFAAALGVLAAPGALPAVFHCAAGKDRTGVLAALLLGGLGVDDDTIAGDYALTAAGVARMRAWAEANNPELSLRLAETPSVLLAAHPEAIRQVLVDLRDEHGSVAAYLGTIGAGDAVLTALADALAS